MKKIFSLFAAVLLTVSLFANEEIAYSLVPTAGTNNSYASNCDVEIDGITWNVTGNSTMIPWRIGGKSLSNVNRTVYSKTAIASNISKIVVEHGTASGITVNSWKVEVASDDAFANIISTLTPTFEASAQTTIERPEGKDWSNAYYRFTYNVSVSGSSNKFLEFVGADFYTASDKVVVKTLKSIALSDMTTEYKQGADFSFDGVCTATYSVTEDDVPVADQQKVVTPTSVSTPDMETVGVQTVTVSYTEGGITKEASYDITVIEKPAPVVLPGDPATMKTGTTAYEATVNTESAVKVGSSKNDGDMTITVPAKTIAIHFFAVAWNDAAGSVSLSVPEGVEVAEESETLTLIADEGIQGNSNNYTLEEDDLSKFRFDVSLANVEAETAITLASGTARRFVVWGATYELEGAHTALDNTNANAKAVKTIVNGQLIIEKAGVKYNVLGQTIR